MLIWGAARTFAAEAVAQQATVFGTPTANLRAGAGVEHAVKLTLKEGDAVTIEKLEGEWFLVSSVDGQKGYIHKNLLKLAANAAAPAPAAPPAQQKPADPPASPPMQINSAAPSVTPAAAKTEKLPAAPPLAAQTEAARVKPPEGQAPSLLQILEAHEAEVKIGLLVAAIAFVLGWICGGSYYVRRDRKHRRRLRL